MNYFKLYELQKWYIDITRFSAKAFDCVFEQNPDRQNISFSPASIRYDDIHKTMQILVSKMCNSNVIEC